MEAGSRHDSLIRLLGLQFQPCIWITAKGQPPDCLVSYCRILLHSAARPAVCCLQPFDSFVCIAVSTSVLPDYALHSDAALAPYACTKVGACGIFLKGPFSPSVRLLPASCNLNMESTTRDRPCLRPTAAAAPQTLLAAAELPGLARDHTLADSHSDSGVWQH